MLAIETRFVGPTNTRGSRIVARVMEQLPTRKVTVEYEHGLNADENHRAAAIALIHRMGWTSGNGYGAWVMGASERGYVFVCDTKHGSDRFMVEGKAK
jgi:hypothetical protein